ncbi:efflux RND transporter periplasmic adaptor subunit [Sporomusa sp.]|uniref:efflux RND transporter periplasmic adaptor subunit n=1 Tax=Sporomusa sp. TaxID=2078658 RepID=UPI002C45E760|nr:efflux RND transporter periplasmic adaptor subunit [Sporomusa sp.]HWR05366.1 efflux RND transporter periplasmic adaptor subunit [Sporomusa sp.]
MKYDKKVAWAAIALLVLTIAAYWMWMLSGQEKTKIPVRRDASEEVLDQARRLSGIGALGRVEPRSRVVVVSYDGDGARVKEILVKEGQAVRKGDVIAVFSDFDQRQAKYAAAMAKVHQTAAKIQAEQSTESYLISEYKRMNELWKAGAISQSCFDEAERNLRQSQATVAALRAELASASADLNFSQKELSQGKLLSPMDGTILAVKSRPGERVGSSGVVEMADLTQLDVVAEVYERDITRVKIGQKAEVKVAGLREPFIGDVRDIGFLIRKNDINNTDPLADRDNRVVEVRITLDSVAIEALRHLIYMQVDVRLI